MITRIVLVAAVLLSTGCAGNRPGEAQRGLAITPMHEVKEIAGRWDGAVLRWGGRQPMTLTVNADGTYVADFPGSSIAGTMRTADGRILWQGADGVNGTLILHEGAGRRMLTGSQSDGAVKYELTPAR
jgi:hypothetical protein